MPAARKLPVAVCAAWCCCCCCSCSCRRRVLCARLARHAKHLRSAASEAGTAWATAAPCHADCTAPATPALPPRWVLPGGQPRNRDRRHAAQADRLRLQLLGLHHPGARRWGRLFGAVLSWQQCTGPRTPTHPAALVTRQVRGKVNAITLDKCLRSYPAALSQSLFKRRRCAARSTPSRWTSAAAPACSSTRVRVTARACCSAAPHARLGSKLLPPLLRCEPPCRHVCVPSYCIPHPSLHSRPPACPLAAAASGGHPRAGLTPASQPSLLHSTCCLLASLCPPDTTTTRSGGHLRAGQLRRRGGAVHWHGAHGGRRQVRRRAGAAERDVQGGGPGIAAGAGAGAAELLQERWQPQRRRAAAGPAAANPPALAGTQSRTQLYLPRGGLEATDITTAKSSEVNVVVPGASGELAWLPPDSPAVLLLPLPPPLPPPLLPLPCPGADLGGHHLLLPSLPSVLCSEQTTPTPWRAQFRSSLSPDSAAGAG